MKRLAAISLVFLAAACSTPKAGTSRNAAVPGHGAISISIVPNPVVARQMSGNTYEFPFDVVVRETGGRAVTVNRVAADVYAVGGIRVASEAWDGAQIRSVGYSTNVPGNGELRYHFAPRKDVKDDRLFGSVYAEIRVEASDDTGTPATATTTVTVTR
jgi:hypothetical protein